MYSFCSARCFGSEISSTYSAIILRNSASLNARLNFSFSSSVSFRSESLRLMAASMALSSASGSMFSSPHSDATPGFDGLFRVSSGMVF